MLLGREYPEDESYYGDIMDIPGTIRRKPITTFTYTDDKCLMGIFPGMSPEDVGSFTNLVDHLGMGLEESYEKRVPTIVNFIETLNLDDFSSSEDI